MEKFVIVEGRALKQAMKIITAIVARHNRIPILGYAKFNLSNDGLRITGTDLDMEITHALDVIDGKGDWSACIDARAIARIARVAGTSLVRIGVNDEAAIIEIADGVAKYDLKTLPASDFPEIGSSTVRGDLIEYFGNGGFVAMLKKVDWCISTEETRYYLNGVCWQICANGRRFVATDGHRLSICKYASEGETMHREMIIPRGTVNVLTTFFAGQDMKVFGSKGNAPLLDIVAPGVNIRTKLIDGTFPDVNRVIPADSNLKFDFVMRKPDILAGIEQATAIGGDRNRAVRFYNGDGKVIVQQRDADFGTAEAKTPIEWPAAGKEEASAFGINSRYLREIVDHCEGEITMRMTDAGSPFLIRDMDPAMTRVVMPMRV